MKIEIEILRGEALKEAKREFEHLKPIGAAPRENKSPPLSIELRSPLRAPKPSLLLKKGPVFEINIPKFFKK